MNDSRMISMRTLLCGALLCAGCGDPSSENSARAENAGHANQVTFTAQQAAHGGVRWAPVQPSTMAATIEMPGKLAANEDRTARLSAPAQGRVIAVHVQPGDRVAGGKPLVTLQSPEASAARADYSKAVARLASTRAAAAYARTVKERSERLLAAKAIARQDLERARADDELAQSEQAQAEAEVERARAALGQLGVNTTTGAMVLQSPINGVVLSREATPGMVVNAGAPLVTVSDIATLWLEIAATEQAAASMRAGARVEFSVPAYSQERFEARVQSVGEAFEPTTRTLPVRAIVANASRKLRPEMFATAWIQSTAQQTGIAVPDSAVQLLDERPVVFVATPDGKGGAVFERRDVQIGGKTAGMTQILNGVSAGDQVVVAGAFAVKSEFARARMPGE